MKCFVPCYLLDRTGNYERFLTDWKDADPDIPELIEARKRMAALGEVEKSEVR